MVPRDNPELAGVIFAEHAEHGYLAAPIARHIIETYYARKEGRPLPDLVPLPRARRRPVGRGRAADGRRRRRGRPAPRPAGAGRQVGPCSNAGSRPTSTGRCWWPCWRSSPSAWR